MAFQEALARVIDETIAPNADATDRTGSFPRAGIDALAGANLLGMTIGTDAGGGGAGLRAAANVIEQLARACGSTAMVMMMHYSAAALLDVYASKPIREAIASGSNLSTLAFSEVGSRSHFWAPLSTAMTEAGAIRLDAQKSWVTSAGEADSYVWSSRPVAADGPMTLWNVAATTPGVRVAGDFDGLGLRGNASRPMVAEGAIVARDAMLADDGAGLNVALQVVLPWFLVLNAAGSLGLMEATTAETTSHLTSTRLEHLGRSLAQEQVPRLDLARMRLETDRTRALLDDVLTAIEAGREDATLRVLEVKAAAGEAAIAVTDLAMKAAGGAAFRKELGIERRFRDARAARVMAPTTDALLDFIGRAVTGLPLLGEA